MSIIYFAVVAWVVMVVVICVLMAINPRGMD